MKLKQIFLLVCVSTTILFHSCKDDENNTVTPVEEIEEDYTFNFTAVKNGDEVKLTWESLNAPTFEKYGIARSVDLITDDPYRVLYHEYGELFYIDDQDETTFTDDSFSEFEDQNYKVFVQLEDQIVLGPTVVIKSESKELPFCYFHGAIIPGTNHMIITGSNLVAKYDFVQDKILEQQEINLSSSLVRVGDAGNGMEVFLFNHFGHYSHFLILDINDLSIKEEKDIGNKIRDIWPSDKGFLFLTTDNTNTTDNSLFSLNRSGLSIIDTAIVQNSFPTKRLLMTPSNPNKIIKISHNKFSEHTFNDNGEFTDVIITDNQLGYEPTRNVTLSPSGDVFIYSQDLSVYSTDDFTRLETSEASHSKFSFFDSQNEDIIYFFEFSSIAKLDRNSGEIESIKYVPDMEIHQIFEVGNEIIYIGGAYATSGCSYISRVAK